MNTYPMWMYVCIQIYPTMYMRILTKFLLAYTFPSPVVQVKCSVNVIVRNSFARSRSLRCQNCKHAHAPYCKEYSWKLVCTGSKACYCLLGVWRAHGFVYFWRYSVFTCSTVCLQALGISLKWLEWYSKYMICT